MLPFTQIVNTPQTYGRHSCPIRRFVGYKAIDGGYLLSIQRNVRNAVFLPSTADQFHSCPPKLQSHIVARDLARGKRAPNPARQISVFQESATHPQPPPSLAGVN